MPPRTSSRSGQTQRLPGEQQHPQLQQHQQGMAAGPYWMQAGHSCTGSVWQIASQPTWSCQGVFILTLVSMQFLLQWPTMHQRRCMHAFPLRGCMRRYMHGTMHACTVGMSSMQPSTTPVMLYMHVPAALCVRAWCRCARVVSWLEHLAAESMKQQGRAAFAQGEGLWRETRTEMRAGTSEQCAWL